MIAPPPTIFHSLPLQDYNLNPYIDVVTVGSCTNGRFEDYIDFFSTFGDGPVAKGTRLIITPASKNVYKQLLTEGYIERFIEASAIINPPGCGPCMGLHQGYLNSGEVCFATGSRNAPGRMGAKDAIVILGGPKVAGLVAKTGSFYDL
jgi:homoaconitase/3-isopropylmalate dehydratase large subunit